MKIVYMITLGDWGGADTYLNSLIKDQVRRHNRIWLIAGTDGKLTKRIQKYLPSVNVIILNTLDRNIHILDTIKAIILFRHIIKEIHPDIIHLNSIMSGIVGRIGTLGLDQRIVYTSHGWSFEPGRLSYSYRMLAWIIEKSLSYFTNKLICVSQNEYNMAIKYHIPENKSQLVTINNGVPIPKNIYRNSYRNSKIFIITMAARFAYPKRQDIMIYSIYKIIKNNPDLKSKIILYLLGNGPYLKGCRLLVKKLHLLHNVIFTGKVNNVLSYYNKSDVVSLISNIEGSPLSLIEAMSVGKPILASNVGGIPELIRDNGISVPNNSNIIAFNIKKMIDNPHRLKVMGNNSYILFLKCYTNDIMNSKTNNVYKRLLHE